MRNFFIILFTIILISGGFTTLYFGILRFEWYCVPFIWVTILTIIIPTFKYWYEYFDELFK